MEEKLDVNVLKGIGTEGLGFSIARSNLIVAGYHFRDEGGKEQVALDYTMTSAFQACPMKFMEGYVHGIRLRQERTSLVFGSAVHSGLASWYLTNNVEEAVNAFKEGYEDREGEDIKTKANGEKLIRGYADRYPDEVWQVLDVEVPIAFQFGEGLYHFVIPDMVVRQGGRVYGVEHKHTKSISKFYFRQFKPNQQLDGQVAGITAKYGSCDGIIVNPIQIQKGGTRIKGVLRPSPYLLYGPRDISTRTIEDIKWWASDMKKVYQEIFDTVDKGYYRANKAQCNTFEGCSYRDLHINHGDEYIRGEYFESKVWNPLDRLKEVKGGK